MSGPEGPAARRGEGAALKGRRVALVGRLASMTRREAERLIRAQGGVLLEKPDASAHLVVVGEEGLPISEGEAAEDWFDDAARQSVEQGSLEVIAEGQWLQRSGLARPPGEMRLYTPAMLAELLGVSVAVIRRWRRRGLIVPAREVRRLPYFDIHEVATARRLAQLLAAGASPQDIEKKLAGLARWLPGVRRPLAQLSVMVQGQEILLRQGDGLVESGGQLRFDFEAGDLGPAAAVPVDFAPSPPVASAAVGPAEPPPLEPDEMRLLAAELEETGQLGEAADVYRAVMAAAGPDPETCFQLAEILYRLGDLSGARERYAMAVELDEDYVEARANLGCVLAETGRRDLAVAAFEGALRYHGGYADAYYHLARTLDEMGRRREAEAHWRTFLALAPTSPWAEEARGRLTPP